MRTKSRSFSYLLIIALFLPLAATAHHGWNWSTGENIQLSGIINSVDLGNPHNIVMLEVDGQMWRTEMGQPGRNQRAGLTDNMLRPGVSVTVDGEPSARPGEKLLKVERLWIDGQEYVLYPSRI
jgi:hypothetical protein